ncbi:ubiquitin-protein ligase E3C-like isoform X2 [Artemia franciscana]|uniref:ubiquitin-protein ligase E3C-like isoform X2 n=1 Tax=Artemia franciscana TaxID=6661 RepID=UPI0032DB8317
MYLFEGKFCSEPEQDLSGRRIVDRDALLSTVHSQREQRKELRLAHVSATKCQSAVRMYLTKTQLKRSLRTEYDEGLPQKDIEYLLKRFNYFYDPCVDESRIRQMSEMALKNLQQIRSGCSASIIWSYRTAQFTSHVLNFVIKVLREGKEGNIPLARFYRFLEAITQVKGDECDSALEKFYRFIFRLGYMKGIRTLVDLKIPPPYEETVKPPTPISAVIFEMITQSFSLSSISLGSELPLAEILVETQQSLRVREIEPTPWILHSILYLCTKSFGRSESMSEIRRLYLPLLSQLMTGLKAFETVDSNSIEEDLEEEDISEEMTDLNEKHINDDSLTLINSNEHAQMILKGLAKEDPRNKEIIGSICKMCHSLLLIAKSSSMHFGLLRTVANEIKLLRHLWLEALDAKRDSVFGSEIPLIQLLMRGIFPSLAECEKIVPRINVFCSLFSWYLFTVHDEEFFGRTEAAAQSSVPFSLSEMIDMSLTLRELCVGLVELAYPSTVLTEKEILKTNFDPKVWNCLFKAVVSLLRHVHTRDTRHRFCPEGTWTASRIGEDIPLNISTFEKKPKLFTQPQRIKYKKGSGPSLSVRESRANAILHEAPFLFSFTSRVKLFQSLIGQDKEVSQAMSEFLPQGNVFVRIRRSYLYEDAFDNLSLENVPNIKKRLRVQLINFTGLDEAGIDGGGILREFTSELLKTAFDPNRGFFKMSEDNMLYPNPNVNLIVEDFPKHYFFIGRMLGKALFENLLVELPLANFFLSKLLGRSSSSDINSLASLDPTLHRNLLYLRDYKGDVSELELDFTIVTQEFGDTRTVELKPGGSSISVTSANRIEYIYLVADYKLNKQIQLQCAAFRQGLADVIPLSWLRMFNYKELHVLISGAEVPIDIQDLKRHTTYSGGYDEAHQVIKNFWKIAEEMSDEQKRKLLRFVTSCSRPPLLGFKELTPSFCIQNTGPEIRLPSASTCMNLLKLPEIQDFKLLKEKVIYAIESGAGFELS